MSLLGDHYEWWWQNQNFGDPHGYLGGKYNLFGKKISFLAWKKNAELFRVRFENTMGNLFFYFVKYRPKRSIFFLLEWIFYSTLWEKCFQIWFLTLQSAPTGKHALSLSCVFRLEHFPRSKIESESIFLIKYFIITFLKTIEAVFFNKVKKRISHCILKFSAEGFRVSCQARKQFFCQMACIYLLNSREGPQSFDFDITYFISNYCYPLTLVENSILGSKVSCKVAKMHLQSKGATSLGISFNRALTSAIICHLWRK